MPKHRLQSMSQPALLLTSALLALGMTACGAAEPAKTVGDTVITAAPTTTQSQENTMTTINPTVQAALEAMKNGDAAAWHALFATNATLSDDGNERNPKDWATSELFGKGQGRITAVDKVEDGGSTLLAQFHSAQWGDFKTSWKFTVKDGKITRLEVSQAN